jgi:hypothetical protein
LVRAEESDSRRDDDDVDVDVTVPLRFLESGPEMATSGGCADTAMAKICDQLAEWYLRVLRLLVW